MEPTPVRVEHDGTLESLAAPARGALLHAEPGVGLSGERAHLLTVGDRKEGERYKCESREHLGQLAVGCCCRESDCGVDEVSGLVAYLLYQFETDNFRELTSARRRPALDEVTILPR